MQGKGVLMDVYLGALPMARGILGILRVVDKRSAQALQICCAGHSFSWSAATLNQTLKSEAARALSFAGG